MKKIIQKIKDNYKLILAVLLAGVVIGWLISPSSNKEATSNQVENHEGHDHEAEKATIWTCSMHPQIRQDHPGKCPICSMDLIPLATLESGDNNEVNPNAIVMTDAAAKLAEIQTVIVKKGTPEKELYLQGKIQADERNIAELTARFGGRIEKLYVNYTGQKVAKGEKLATIYSPGLITAQKELLEAIAYKDSRPALYNAAKGKLKLWDLTDAQIEAIEKKGEPQVYFDVLSPISGTVTMRHVALGDYVKEGNALFQVIDLSKVWGMFDAYETDLPWIKLGDKVAFTVQALPGKTFSAKVSYIDPFINAKTRVAKVRVNITNTDEALKPEMFLNGTISSQIAESSHDILVPKSSILWTGKRAIVYVKLPHTEDPSFVYREVVLGPEAGNFYVIASGLQEGEEIATNGVFKIDAAAQLQGLPSMMNPDGGKVNTMPGMDMGGSDSKPSTEHKSMDMKVDQNNVPEAFKKELTAVYSAYIEMKNALVSADPKKAAAGAKSVEQALGKVEMELLKGDAHIAWMAQLKEMKKSIQAISGTANIDKQRLEFASFNTAFYKSIKTFGLEKTEAYYQYCPMANDDAGAYWLSETKAIRNPYFGDMMLECGETKETLK